MSSRSMEVVHMATRFQQAVSGLDISRGGGVVLVNDGDSRWLVAAQAWREAAEVLAAKDELDGDEGGAEAYTQLCAQVRREAKRFGLPMVSMYESIGTDDLQQGLVRLAHAAGLPTAKWMDLMIGEE